MESAENVLGDDFAKVIEFKTLKEMESMFCTKCPLYGGELEKRKKDGRDAS
jgi:hypothetical protein